MKTIHAVLTADKMYYTTPTVSGGYKFYQIDIDTAATVLDVVALMQEHRIDVMWMTPGSPYAQWTTDNLGDIAEYDMTVSTSKNGTSSRLLKNITGWKRAGTWEEKRLLTLTWPERTPMQWFPSKTPQALDPMACLSAIHYAGLTLNTEINANPGVTGRSLISACNSGKRRLYLSKPEIDMTTLPDDLGYDMDYLRVLDQSVSVFDDLVLLALDKNSEHIAAASSSYLGVGTPEHTVLGRDSLITSDVWKETSKLPGYWLVDIDPSDLPERHPLRIDTRGRLQRWVTTPIMQWLQRNGVAGCVLETWLWPEGKRILDTTATTIWDARQALSVDSSPSMKYNPGKELGYYTIKRIATAMIGLLGNATAAKYKPEWYRNDWRVTVIEDGKVRILDQVAKIEEHSGIQPIAITVDEVWYIVTRNMLDNGFIDQFKKGGLGGWKVSLCEPLDKELLGCFGLLHKNGDMNDAGGAAGMVREIMRGRS